MNTLKDYSDYLLETRYYIVWYLDLDRTYEERVSVEKFVQALDDLNQYDDVPYSVKCKYFVKYYGIDFVEVSKEVYRELYKWQHNVRMHEIYEKRKHRDKYDKIDIYNISDEVNIEETIIENICDEAFKEFLKSILSKHQYEIIHSLIFEQKKKAEIARENHISRQALNNSINCIRKKLKKFLN